MSTATSNDTTSTMSDIADIERPPTPQESSFDDQWDAHLGDVRVALRSLSSSMRTATLWEFDLVRATAMRADSKHIGKLRAKCDTSAIAVEVDKRTVQEAGDRLAEFRQLAGV
jgi:hypothetical protein